jgi:geranylgeranyl reductase family protein
MGRYDAIVVGAGPAGSTAAFRLATAGASVLLLDRAKFPRDKPCGGGVTLRAARLLPFAIDPIVEDVVGRVELRLRYGRSFARGGGDPLVLMTQRRRLDHFLASRAAEAGAIFREEAKVTAVEADDANVRVRVGNEWIAGASLVGADGVNGIVGRALGLGGNRAIGVALEGNMPYETVAAERYRGRAVLELGVVPGGYGWVFPKGDHVNIGIGGWENQGPRLRAALRQLCAEHHASFDELEGLRGYRLPLRDPGSVLARGRVLVVGDAAGLVDPVSGDGMFEGFLSAEYASETVLDLLAGRSPSLDTYGARLSARLARHLWASWGVKGALDRFPRTTFAVARTRLVWRAVERLVRGDVADIGDVTGLARPPLKALALLARASGDLGRAYRGA